uniref:Uncharacterized protein n=1 Tax=Ditylenchus dipsaci TaxID=166011 RepID=A0A915DSX9_9BILA
MQLTELHMKDGSKPNLLTEDDIRLFNNKINSSMPKETDGIHYTNPLNTNLLDGDDEYGVEELTQQWDSGQVPFVIADDKTLNEEFYEQFSIWR